MGSESHDDASEANLFAEVFRRAPDVMSIVRVSDAVMFEVNEAFEKVSGYTREQLVGKSSRDFPWWPNEEERERVLGLLRDQGSLRDVEVRFSGPHGEVVSRISASPILCRGERCVIWRAADITEQRRAERVNRALEERLHQKQNLERLGVLAGRIAHDFNNLLVGVLGNADLLLKKVTPDSPLGPPLRAILTSAQRMSEHTRELLDYAGHTVVKRRPLRLDVLVDEATERARRVVDPAVELEVQICCAGPVWILGDAGQIGRMLVNLIKSAAGRLHGQTGSVRVSIDRSGDDAAVCVRDTAHGIEDSMRALMFDPFASTKHEGRGLGLASIPGIVARHAGSISVETPRAGGTSVTVRIPLREPTAAELPSPSPERRLRGRALVVDDEPQVRAVARSMLAALGFDVMEAGDGAASLEILQRAPRDFTLVVLDASMPGLNGAETLARLRLTHPQLPVVLCSGYSRADFTDLLEHEPRTGFLTKPFRLEQLATAIESLVGSGGQDGAKT